MFPRRAPALPKSPLVGFETVMSEELEDLRRDIGLPKNPSQRQMNCAVDAAKEPLAALCLSGGGIRSASFALGIIQGFNRFGLLEKFTYLSTVSGGGYVGSWLSAWRHHAGSDDTVFKGLDRTRHKSGDEAGEIRDLRADSNYLTPKRGLSSADTWAALALVIRNLILNWMIFVSFFMAVLLIPKVFEALLYWLRGPGGIIAYLILLLAGAILLIAGLCVSMTGRLRSKCPWITNTRFVLMALLPILGAAICFTGIATGGPMLQRVSTLWLLVFGGLIGAVAYVVALLAAQRLSAAASHRLAVGIEPATIGRRDTIYDAGAWAIAGAVAGIVIASGISWAKAYMGYAWEYIPYRDCLVELLVIFGIPWVALSLLSGELIYVGLRSYAARGDMDREWLARSAGWLAAVAVLWCAVSAICVYGPQALRWHWWTTFGIGSVSGLVTTMLGSSSLTAATTARKAASYLSLEQLGSIAGLVFAIVLLAALSLADDLLIGQPTGWWPLCLGLILFLFSLGASWFINVNRFSLHSMYRNRLVRGFLGAARAGVTGADARNPDPFTGLDPKDNLRMAELAKSLSDRRCLYPVLNMALNVVATRNLAWQERKAESFTVTPRACGNPNPHVKYRETASYGDPNGGITLGTAMAISGAAASPNEGYNSSPLVGFLMMMFNVRLGWWLGNPARDTYRRDGPYWGLFPALKELLGMTTDDGNWVYLSDGGHFENLGIYEMVRRRCRVIVVSDADCDPDCAFENLGNAVRKIYIDQGVGIDFQALKLDKRQTPPKPGVYCALGTITYPDSAKTGWILYIKPGYHGTEPADIQSYANAHDAFPHETTADQWFTESQLEAYRGLGAHVAELICNGGQPLCPGTPPPKMCLSALKEQAANYLRFATRGV